MSLPAKRITTIIPSPIRPSAVAPVVRALTAGTVSVFILIRALSTL